MTGVARRGALVWFRRDLRDYDQHALAQALAAGPPVYAAFVFDRDILDALPAPADRRVEFIWESVRELDAALRRRGGGLIVRHARAVEEMPRLADALGVAAVYANHDYEPAALDRDAAVAHALADRGIAFRTCKDQVVFERAEVMTQAGRPFTVFTPYRNAWLRTLAPSHLVPHDVDAHAAALAPPPPAEDRGLPALAAMGFARTNLAALGIVAGMAGGAARFADFRERIGDYKASRDFPAVKGPSYLSVHLRFGTVSVRELVAYAHACSLRAGGDGAATWLSELIWREFYAQILWHHPHVVARAFKPEYDALAFPNDGVRFDRVVRGAHRLPDRRRRDAAAERDRLHAQPPAHDRGELPRQGPARRLALGRAGVRRPADRLRPRVEQRRMAVGGVDRLRRAALLPHLQPGDAVAALRCRGRVHPPLRARARAARRTRDPRAVDGAAGDPAGEGRGDRPRLSAADRRPRRLARSRRSSCSASSGGPPSDEDPAAGLGGARRRQTGGARARQRTPTGAVDAPGDRRPAPPAFTPPRACDACRTPRRVAAAAAAARPRSATAPS